MAEHALSRLMPFPAARPGMLRRWRTRARATLRRCTASSRPRARAWPPQRAPRDPALLTGLVRASWRLTVRSTWAAAPQSTSGRAPLRCPRSAPCSHTLWQRGSLEAAAARCAAAGAAEARRARSDSALCWPRLGLSRHGRRPAWRCRRHPVALVCTQHVDGGLTLQQIFVPFTRHARPPVP
jgi:hypothetical protein